jgi:hypothetical protein
MPSHLHCMPSAETEAVSDWSLHSYRLASAAAHGLKLEGVRKSHASTRHKIDKLVDSLNGMLPQSSVPEARRYVLVASSLQGLESLPKRLGALRLDKGVWCSLRTSIPTRS